MIAGVLASTAEPEAFRLGPMLLSLEVDLSVYSLRAVSRACYKLTGRCYVFLSRPLDPALLTVTLLAKTPEPIELTLAGELYNELLDQQIRESLEIEMGPVREMIVAQAFAEGNLLDSLRDDGNYQEDPLDIG
jgi:His-Xaa-Ser system protein HxsD